MPKTRLGEKVEVFGRAGVARSRITTTENGHSSVSSNDTVLAYGAGLSYFLTPATSLNVDYMDDSQLLGNQTRAVTVGVGSEF